ncbi:proline-rich protein 2-like [Melitaea cinxia]|uniref:proline-rich protein 2-like n=1 Tax=Melitaea cinxia TaxID=113334 RepID=UPI001E2749CD|nr:proline-rich protein 2-like [Melitaea cinxia]
MVPMALIMGHIMGYYCKITNLTNMLKHLTDWRAPMTDDSEAGRRARAPPAPPPRPSVRPEPRPRLIRPSEHLALVEQARERERRPHPLVPSVTVVQGPTSFQSPKIVQGGSLQGPPMVQGSLQQRPSLVQGEPLLQRPSMVQGGPLLQGPHVVQRSRPSMVQGEPLLQRPSTVQERPLLQGPPKVQGPALPGPRPPPPPQVPRLYVPPPTRMPAPVSKAHPVSRLPQPKRDIQVPTVQKPQVLLL